MGTKKYTCPSYSPMHPRTPLIAVALGCGALALHAQPDPKEIPVPPIQTDLPSLPGVADLPVHLALPDPLVMKDGTLVTTPEQWKARREEMKAILAYYAVGRMPPAPGNVQGSELKSEPVLGGKVTYRLVHLTFGPGEKLALDIGIFAPAGAQHCPAIILQSFSPPGATALPRLPQGPNQGKGQDVLLIVGSGSTVAGVADPGSNAGPPPPGEPAPRPAGAGGAAPGKHADNAATHPGGPGKTGPQRAKRGGFPGFGPQTAESVAKRFAYVFDRGYAIVQFNPNDCAEDTTLRMPDGSWAFRTTRFFPAYPGYDWGILAAWAWGASRVADYLQNDPAVDPTKLIITGASRDGKSAMIAAAFDERLMGAPVVTGGGGIGAYRYAGPNHSETLDIMMKKYPNWFSPHLHEFWGSREKLPFDEHWFLALCAPRPFLACEGDQDIISLPDAVHHSFDAARPAYALLGAADNLGVNYAHHPHAFTQEDWVAIMDFADQHLRGLPAKRTFDHFQASTYNVRDYGAVGDGQTKDTAAFQKALDACAVNGGGVVVVPDGHYLIGSVVMGAKTTLRLADDSVITGSGDLADYPMIDIRWEGRWQPGHRALIHAAYADHIGIVGKGKIEGNAAVAQPQNPRGAVVLEPISCTDVRWEGFSITQGGNWATHPTYCTDVLIKDVKIVGRRDGIDIDSCKHVVIDGCDLDTGDDSISLKSGRGLDGARLAKPTEDVLITHTTLHGRRFACIGIGSETSGGIKDVRIEHCTFAFARTDAIYIKTRIGRAGTIENISGDDLDVQDANFLRVNLISSGNLNTADDAVAGIAGYPIGRNFVFRNVRLKHAHTLADVTKISPERPLQGLVLENISGTCTQGIALANVLAPKIERVNVTGVNGPLVTRQ